MSHKTNLIAQAAHDLAPRAFCLTDLLRHPYLSDLEYKQVQSALHNAIRLGDVKRAARGIYVARSVPLKPFPTLTAHAQRVLTAQDRRHIDEHGTPPPARPRPAPGSQAAAPRSRPPQVARSKRPPTPESLATREAIREALRGRAALNAHRIARVSGLNLDVITAELDQMVWAGEVAVASHAFGTYNLRVTA